MSDTIYKQGITIVMPCLNEALTLKTCIEKAKSFLLRSEYKTAYQIIVADNGSSDNSVEIAKQLGATVVHVENRGYGSALLGGIKASEYEYIVMGDADDSYDFSAIEPFIEKLQDGYDLVMGNRFLGGIEKGAMSFSHKYIGNPLLSGLGRLFYKTNIGDFHCGLRAFRKSKIMPLKLCTTGMEFASEMVVKAVLFHLRIAEVPCKLYPDGRERPSHLRSIPDGFRHLFFLLIYSPKWLFLYPGILISGGALLLLLIICVHPIMINGIQFEAITMVYMSIALIVGFQICQFAIYTEIYGQKIGQFPPRSSISEKMVGYMKHKSIWVGMFFSLWGLMGIISTVIFWKNSDFGQLDSHLLLRKAILFGTFTALGINMIFSFLFINILDAPIHFTEME